MSAADRPLKPTARRMAAAAMVASLGLAACGSFFNIGGPVDPKVARATNVADPGFPAGYRRWPTADAVPDENTGTVHRLYRAPDVAADRKGRFPVGALLVKEHVIPGEDDLTVRVDVRRRLASGTFQGWEYESFDPATQKRLEIDAEACDLCHQTAPGDGTFTAFGTR